MDADDLVTSELLAALSCQPFDAQAAAMRNAVGAALKHMSTHRLLETRRRIAVELDESTPAVRMTIEIIDGQLALREIACGAFWR